MIRYLEDEETLSKFLQASDESPCFLISDAFPKGFLPNPIVPTKRSEGFPYDKLKESKKIQYIPRDFFQKHRKSFHSQLILEELNLSEWSKFTFSGKGSVPHNSINRLTGMVEESGGLFFSVIRSTQGTEFDLYFSVIDEFKELIFRSLKSLSEWGYGKDSSTGGGSFEIMTDAKGNQFHLTDLFQNPESFSHFMTLSPIVPAQTDPSDASYQIFTRFGKVGREMEFQESEYGYFKTPVLYMKSGSVFKGNGLSVLGSFLKNIHKDPNVRQNARSRVIGLNLV